MQLFSLNIPSDSNVRACVPVYYASGTSIAQFPSDGIVVYEKLKNQGHEVITGESKSQEKVPVLGLYEPTIDKGGGRVVLYGDSNCFDNSHMQKGSAIVDSVKHSFIHHYTRTELCISL